MTDESAIEMKASFFFLMFLLYFFKPAGALNGHPVTLQWGSPLRIPVPPGRHQVEMWAPYLFLPKMGLNGILVDVAPGQVVSVQWRAPWFVFMKGSIKAVAGGAQPLPPVQPQQFVQPQPQPQQFVQPQPQPQSVVQAPMHAAAPVTQPGGWHADPSGRHELRYWDGTSWTPHVSDQGATATDPL